MTDSTELTTHQAAEALGYDVKHVQRLLRAGTIRGRKVGGKVWLVPVSEVERLKVLKSQNPSGRLPRSDKGVKR